MQMESSACTSGADSDHNSPTDTEEIVAGEFDSLYQRILENAGGSIKKRAVVLESWVEDLKSQNRFLIHAVRTLEKKALQKISQVEALKKAKCTQSGLPEQVERYQNRIAELDNAVDCLKKTIEEKDAELARAACNAAQLESARVEDCNQKTNLIAENSSLKVQIQKLSENIEQLKAEHENLVDKCDGHENESPQYWAICRADFDKRIDQLEFDLTAAQMDLEEKDELLQLYARNVTKLSAELCEQKKKCVRADHALMLASDDLKKANEYVAELQTHSCPQKPQSAPSRGSWNISLPTQLLDSSSRQKYPDCEMNQTLGCGDSEVVELREKIKNQKDLQIALAGEVAEKHDAIISLKEQITELDDKLRQTEIQAHFKDDIIRELRKEVRLGRAKESLAEMLGLKEGPRVQMKSRIDRLSSELDEKRSEIARLNDLIDNSSLMNLENQVKTLTLDLESRDKKMLAMCDKLDYIRSYLNQLKCEEQLSIKCGLEALLTELNDDAEKNREVRRNVSISLDREPNDGVIIINHRSHSLPDAALQKFMKKIVCKSLDEASMDIYQSKYNIQPPNFADQNCFSRFF